MLAQKLLNVAQVGGTVVLYLLIVLSVFSIGVIVDRWWYFRKRGEDVAALSRTLLKKLRVGDLTGSAALLKASPSIEAAVVYDALDWYEDGDEAVAEVLAIGIKERRPQFESGLVFLGTLGNNAPFIGLFGTVLGVVTAFRELGATTAGAAAGMGNVMGGIAEALVATAIGILVALPAVIAYNIFQKKSADVEENVGTLGGALLAHMKSRRQGSSSIGIASHRAAADPDEKIAKIEKSDQSPKAATPIEVKSAENGKSRKSSTARV